MIVRELSAADQARYGKRFVAEYPPGLRPGTVRFGQPGAHTWIDGASARTKINYIRRHAPRENWEATGFQTAGFLSRWIIWGPYRSAAKNAEALGFRFVRN